jgi:trans-2-enoyl-CoA reductase
MEQAVVYKFKSINKLPEIHQYSISQISNLTTGKLAEKTYRPKPYSSNKVISLIHKKITKEQQREVDFIYKNLFKKNIEGIYAHPCPYIMREKYNY